MNRRIKCLSDRERISVSLVKVRGLILTLLLAAVTAQPSLAAPALCTMPGQHEVMICSSCCMKLPCCAVKDRAGAEPIASLFQSTAQDQIVSAPSLICNAIVGDLLPPVEPIGFILHSRFSHSPPPFALSCIRLI